MVNTDTRTLQEILHLAREAGVEYIRVGDVEIRFPGDATKAPEVYREIVPEAQRGKVMHTADPVPGYSKAFRGVMPKFRTDKTEPAE